MAPFSAGSGSGVVLSCAAAAVFALSVSLFTLAGVLATRGLDSLPAGVGVERGFFVADPFLISFESFAGDAVPPEAVPR